MNNLGGLLFFLGLSAFAHADSQPAPEAYKVIPAQQICQAWDHDFAGQSHAVGPVKIETDLSGDPTFSFRSKVKGLNFTFGRRVVGGVATSDASDYCSYVYDQSMGDLEIKYFCSDLNEKSWMNNVYSQIIFSPGSKTYEQVCKQADRHNPGLNVINCWTLKECK